MFFEGQHYRQGEQSLLLDEKTGQFRIVPVLKRHEYLSHSMVLEPFPRKWLYRNFSFFCQRHGKWEVPHHSGYRFAPRRCEQDAKLARFLPDCLKLEFAAARFPECNWWSLDVLARKMASLLVSDFPEDWLPAFMADDPDVKAQWADKMRDILRIAEESYRPIICLSNSWSAPFFRSWIPNSKAELLQSTGWVIRDRTLYGALIAHRRRFYIHQPGRWVVLAVLPDVSLENWGYIIRVHPLCKTVDSARRWIYNLPKGKIEWKEV